LSEITRNNDNIDDVVAIARRMIETQRYNHEFIREMTSLTPNGYVKAVQRYAVMFCARQFLARYDFQAFTKMLNLNEIEIEDLKKYKEERSQ
jgi:anaerobic selenocysteine-containing dehydrogenase